MVRDPRDLIISAYFSHRYSHSSKDWPELIEHRKRLHSTSKDKGLFLEFEFSKKYLEHIVNWNYKQQNILEIKMEKLASNPYEYFIEILDFLKIVDFSFSNLKQIKYALISIFNSFLKKCNLPLSAIKIKKISIDMILKELYKKRFSAITQGRKKGLEDIKSHYRKGVAGDWANHFQKEHIDYFKKHYNDILLKLNYELTPNW